MNFSWTKNTNNNISLIDVGANYRMITEEFCKYYYKLFDNNFLQLNEIYQADSFFTFLDEEMIGFCNLVEKIKQYNIQKFTHQTINVNSQPIGERTLLINTCGKLSVNDSMIQYHFSETILLQRDDNNRFKIHRSMFKLMD